MTGRCLALALWVIGMSATLPAECVVGRVPDMKRHAAFVFDGTVTVVKPVRALEQAATIEVHRVWKGNVPKEFSVYFVPGLDGPFVTLGKRQVFFARPLNEVPSEMSSPMIDRSGAPDRPWISGCSGLRSDDTKSLRQLGRSRKPS